MDEGSALIRVKRGKGKRRKEKKRNERRKRGRNEVKSVETCKQAAGT